MATTTPAAIMARFRAVLEATPLLLTLSPEPFSFDLAPNAVVNTIYRIEDGGVRDTRPVGNNQFVRADRLTVYLVRKLAFNGQTEIETLEGTLKTVEQYLLADDAAHSYHASVENRRIARLGSSDVIVASLSVVVDYDFDAST